MKMNKLVFATDGSTSSKKAADVVSTYLEKWPELQVTAVYITNNMVFMYDGIVPNNLLDFANTVKDEVEAQTKMWFQAYGERVQFVHATGHPATRICDIAQTEGADLIVVGSHGKDAVDKLLLGSVSHGVLNRAKVPVLVVR